MGVKEEIDKAFKKKKIRHRVDLKGGWLTRMEDPDLLLEKFVARHGHLPIHYTYMQLSPKKAMYVILGPIESNA